MILVDSSAWLEFFSDGPNAAIFEKVIVKAEKNIVVPTILLYEVFKKVTLEKGEDLAIQIAAHLQTFQVVDLSAEIAMQAVHVSLQYKLPLADSIIYATALAHDATLWTQDDDFKNLPQARYVAHGKLGKR